MMLGAAVRTVLGQPIDLF